MYKIYTQDLCWPPGRMRQILLTMKLTVVLLITAILHVSASTYAQNITLNEKNASLEQVINKIGSQSGYNFLYGKSTLVAAKPVTISVKNASLSQALDLVFQDQPLQYVIKDNAVVIQKKDAPNTNTIQTPLPPKDITGQVLTKEGVPLDGASILIKRTKTGVLTDVKGDFVLRDVLPSDIIEVSFIGYKTLEVPVGDKSVFNLIMTEATNSLDQVVVQAYGKTTDRLNTGSISTVTAAQIERQPEMNPLASLVGQVPGLVVTQTSGYASAPFQVQLEGRSSIGGLPSDPLYIIDGVPLSVLNVTTSTGQTGVASGVNGTYSTGTPNGFNGPANGISPLFSLNPSDIESITVLKDADATSIYGSRGAQGVIIINTKKGKAGKTQVTASAYQGASEVTNYYQLLNTQQYIQMREEAFKNDGIIANQGNAYDLLKWNTNSDTNWQKFLWGATGETSDIQLSLSGGDKQNTFRLSGSYHRETPIYSQSNGSDIRGTINFNYQHTSLDEKLKLSFTSSYAVENSTLVSTGYGILNPPDAPPIFNGNGQLNFSGWQPTSNAIDGSASLLQPYNSKISALNNSIQFSYALFKELSFSTNIGYSTNQQSQKELTPIETVDPYYGNPFGSASFGNNTSSNFILEPNFNYNTLIGKGKLTGLLGGSFQSSSSSGNTVNGGGYVNDDLLSSIGSAVSVSSSDAYSQYKYISVFGRLNYNWEDKYLLNLSGRRDGTSRFGPGHEFGNFWAIGGAYIFSEESWFKQNLQFLSFGKLRGSYGISGDAATGDYEFLSRWQGLTYFDYQNAAGYSPIQLANPNLQWQTARKLEIALDLGFLKDRIKLEGSWYRNVTGNQLIQEDLPTVTGFSQIYYNSPATVQNTGIESTLSAILIDKGDLHWSVNFLIGSNNNKLLSFPGLAQSPYAHTYVIGEALNHTQLLHIVGVDPQTGQYIAQDKNHDGQIDIYNSDKNNDLYYTDLTVKYDGSFSTELSFKGLQLDVMFYFKKQLLPNAIYIGIPGTLGAGNISLYVYENSWQKPGDVAKFARFTTTGATTSDGYYSASNYSYSDGSYIRLRNLSLSYPLRGNWVNKAGLNSIRVFARGENLLLFTKYQGVDPDAPILGVLPPAKIFTAGLDIKL